MQLVFLKQNKKLLSSTRNAQVVQTRVSQSTSETSTTTSQRVVGSVNNDRDGADRDSGRGNLDGADDMDDGTDPLAQTFLLRKRADVS